MNEIEQEIHLFWKDYENLKIGVIKQDGILSFAERFYRKEILLCKEGHRFNDNGKFEQDLGEFYFRCLNISKCLGESLACTSLIKEHKIIHQWDLGTGRYCTDYISNVVNGVFVDLTVELRYRYRCVENLVMKD